MHNQSDTCCQPKEGIQIMFGKKKNQESLSMQKPNFLYIFTLTILKQICADFVLISIESKMKMKKIYISNHHAQYVYITLMCTPYVKLENE